ncbi:MAG: GntR family transcriptional regulator [Usitatibacter sp.]
MAARARTRAGGANAPKSVAAILAALRERIANQEIPPGAKLRETELAVEFKVPRTRIREALNTLEQRRLVERIPNRGAVVSRLDYAQALQIYDLRIVLEGLAARLATENGPAARWKKELESFKGPMKAVVASNDLEPYIERYESMRRAIIAAAANPLLAEMLDNIYEKTQVLIRRILILPGRAEVGRLQHVAMLQAMASGKAQEAERLRREGLGSARLHLEKFQKYLL